MEMEITDDRVKHLNKLTNDLGDAFDTSITDFVDKLSAEDNVATPFIVMGALANIMIKLVYIMGEKRQFIFDTLNEMIPDDETFETLKKQDDNVIPLRKPDE